MASTISAGITTTTALSYSADTSGVLQLQTNGGTTAITIDTSQNVGVGVTPSAWGGTKALEVGSKGTALFNYSSTDSYFTQNAYFASGWTYGSTAAASTYRQSAGAHYWQTAPSGTGAITFTTAMTLDASSNLLVGTPSNPYNAKAAYVQTSNGTVISLTGGATTALTQIAFVNPNGLVGSVTTSGSSTTYVTSSDYRLKENIEPMTGALARISQLKPVTYSWKVDGSAGEGFIAHELQAVVPDCVTGEKDAVNEDGSIKPQGIDTSFLVATLTAAIQELSAQVTTLQSQVTALQAKG